MYRVLPTRTSTAPVVEVLLDATVGFMAVVTAASSIEMLFVGNAVNPSTLYSALGFAFVMAMLQSFVGLYRHDRIRTVAVLARLSLAILAGGYVSYLLVKAFGISDHPGRLMVRSVVYYLAALVVFRGLGLIWRDAVGSPRVLILGTGTEARAVHADLAKAGISERDFVGFIRAGRDEDVAVPRERVCRSEMPLVELVDRLRVDEIIVATREQRGGAVPMDQLLACRTNGVRILDAAAFYERSHGAIPIDSLKASWLVYGSGFLQGPGRRAAKRLFDIVSSLLLLVIGLPVMVVAAVAIKLDSAGPVIYRQQRIGHGGRLFWCLKLRSMRTDAEKDGIARWATKGDARITRVGAFIRKTRIDELPQLFSVLRGDMSMVGPRPERPAFVEQLREQIPLYDLRHGIKPGVTGWAQVRYRYGETVEDARQKHQFDLYYIKNNSIWLDLRVLVETVTVVLFQEGAQ